VSYYTYGAAIALGLDLSLREMSNGKITLDDYMRAMWRTYGEPGGTREGYVDHPYTIEDAEAMLATVSGDAAFARDFFSRYVEGHDVADYARLLAPAGLLVRKRNAGRAWLGDVAFERRSNVLRVSALVQPDWPVYQAGVEQDDELRQLDDQRVASPDDVQGVLRRHKPGDRVDLVFADRTGAAKTASVTLTDDPRLEIVPVESAGGALTAAQRTFRERWLGSKRMGPQ
jgi:predicted metalloprotease with PDZ domain